jgi:hypothetical protein
MNRGRKKRATAAARRPGAPSGPEARVAAERVRFWNRIHRALDQPPAKNRRSRAA